MSTDSNIAELREHLFATLRDLRSGKMDLESAKVVNDTAQVLINSAKVEIDYIKQTGALGTGFIDTNTKSLGTGVTVHRIKG